jgi:hypothetical protein
MRDKVRKEEKLNSKNLFGVNDFTPADAVKEINRSRKVKRCMKG